MRLTAKEQRKRERERLTLNKYIHCYADLLNDINEIDKMIRTGIKPEEIVEKWKEILVCDDARWHLWTAQENSLGKEHQRLGRKSRKAKV